MRTPKVYTAAAFAAVLLPLAGMVASLVQTGDPLHPWADHAILQIETIAASHGDQLLGTYSRYMWSHPGPPLFYIFTPLYELFGSSPAALNATAGLINAAAVAGIVLVVRRFAGTLGALFAGSVAALYLVELGPVMLRDFWVPYVVILPFALYVVACAGLAAGTTWLMPLVAGTGCYLALTNMSLAPATGITGVAALVIWAVPHVRGRRLPAWPPLAVSAGITAVMCFPPVYEELDHSPGNLATLRKFFDTPDPGHPLSESLDALANSTSSLVLGLLKTDAALPIRGGATLVLIAVVLLLVAGAVVAVRGGRTFAAALCAVTLVAFATEAYALTSVRGPLHTYLVLWFSAAAVPAAIGVGLALGPEVRLAAARRLAAPVMAAAIAGLTVWGFVDFAGDTSLANDPAYSSADAGPIVSAVDGWIAKEGYEHPYVSIRDGMWFQAATVVSDRYKRGESIVVEPGWLFMFGPYLKPKGGEDVTIVFAAQGAGEPAENADLIARRGGASIWGVPASG